MRRLIPAAAFVLALAVIPALAQHGGGHGGGGHGGGFGGHAGMAGHSGGFGGIHGGGSGFHGSRSPGFRSPGFSHPGGSNRGFAGRGFAGRGSSRVPFRRQGSREPFASNRFHHFDRDRDDRFHRFGFRNCWNCGRGWGWGWPWWNAGIDPWWWWDSGSSYDQDREREIAMANEMNQQSLEEQRRQSDQDSYSRQDSGPPPRNESISAADPTPATVLVFRDQHKQEVQNYAIVGSTLWVFAAQRTQKIPLSDLDLDATVKVNDDRGVDFRVPSRAEAQ